MSVFASRAGLTLALAFAAALAWSWLRWPLPWMLGPLLATSLASILGLPTRSWTVARNAGQWVIGTALGLYFTPEVARLIGNVWWAVIVAIVWALIVGWLMSRFLRAVDAGRMGGTMHEQLATCWFAAAIGGASEMTLLAEREGGRTDLVAAAHSLRIVIVVLLVPFAFRFAGVHGFELLAPGARVVNWLKLPLLMGSSLGGAWLVQRLGPANPWFIGSLAVAMGWTLAGVELSAMPVYFSNAAQLVIGISLGVRFQAEFLHTAPRWLVAVAVGTLGMVVVCGAFAWLLAHATGLNVPTLILGTSPGGIAEMSITAKVLGLGVPVVTAFQVCRLVAVLLLVGPLFGKVGPR